MARWEVSFAVERRRGVPLFLQIAAAITTDIQRGRLRPGDALPGTRSLARALGVQRMTVVAAFDELVAEGWIVNQRARGAFVSGDLPEIKPRRLAPGKSAAGMVARAGFDLLPAPDPELPIPVPRGGLLFAPSRPDVRLAPGKVLGRAVRRAMSTRPDLLSYGDPEGHPRLRRAIARMLVLTRGLAVGPENVCMQKKLCPPFYNGKFASLIEEFAEIEHDFYATSGFAERAALLKRLRSVLTDANTVVQKQVDANRECLQRIAREYERLIARQTANRGIHLQRASSRSSANTM